jgi:hypothetical protein
VAGLQNEANLGFGGAGCSASGFRWRVLQNEANFGRGWDFGLGRGFGVLQNKANFLRSNAALGLEFFELAERIFHGPVQTLFADAEVHEGPGVVTEGFGGRHYGVNFGVLRVEIAGGFGMSQTEHAIFD